MPGEFEIIAKYFAPLAAGAAGAEGLGNDGAIFTPDAGLSVVVTADAMVAGVHFLPEDPPDLIGRKLLRVNLSDLAAMGARPRGYLLVTAFPEDIDDAWIAAFVEGLARDQAEFGIDLLGGDTVSTPGPLTLSLTAFGEMAQDQVLHRSGARAGDDIYVSGTIGDGALGLMALRGSLDHLGAEDCVALAERYRLPVPRIALGQALAARGLARGALDISDGLVADLGHICDASGLGAYLSAELVPLSEAARRALDVDSGLCETILTGGDDYELLFTAAPEQAEAIAALARELSLPLIRIGHMSTGRGVRVEARDRTEIILSSKGWAHF